MPEHMVYLVRHGKATSKDTDPQRPLTTSGIDEVTLIAAWAASVGLQVQEIWHSGKLRAEQTADIFAKHLSVTAPEKVSGLAPNDDVAPIAEQITAVAQSSLMLVGHLPFLGRLASLLLCGNADLKTINMEAGALVALSKHDGDWTMHCLMQPRLVSNS